MAQVHILSVLLFWREEKISAFWVDLCARLQLDNTAQKKFNSPENQATIGIDKQSWVDKIFDPVGNYLTQIQTVERYKKKLDGKNVFELLKSFRNLASHKFGCSSIAEIKGKPEPDINSTTKKSKKLRKQKAAATRAEDLASEVDKKFEHGRVKFWLENFPEFSLITCQAGYETGVYFNQVNMTEIPGLYKYSEELSNWIKTETTIGKTEIWKHSFTFEEMNVSFLGIPDCAAVDLGNRELLTLNWMPGKQTTTCVLQIDRKSLSTWDETSDLFKKTYAKTQKQNGSSTIELEFAVPSDPIFPFIAFSDVLPSALQACLNIKSKGKQCVVFTNQSVDYIKSTVHSFFNSRNVRYTDDKPITWADLSAEYKGELIKESFPLHDYSNIKFNLSDICRKFVFSSTQITGGTSSVVIVDIVEHSNLKIDAMLLELMHNKSRLIYTGIVKHEVPIPRCVSLVEPFKAPFKENELIEFIVAKEKSASKNLYLICGREKIGMSTFLANVGHSFVLKGEFVLLTTCSRICSLVTKTSKNDFVKILWHQNEFAQEVAHYVLQEKVHTFTLIIDSFHEKNETEQEDFVKFFLNPFVEKYNDLVFNIFLAGRSDVVFKKLLDQNQIDMARSSTSKVFHLELRGIGNIEQETYTRQFSGSINRTLNIISLDVSLKDCVEFVNVEFGHVARTPIGCKIIREIYTNDVYFTSQGALNIESLRGPNIYEKFHIMNLREDVAKTFLNDGVSKDVKINSASINMCSPIFKLYKETVERHLGLESFRLKFPNIKLVKATTNNNTPVLDSVMHLVKDSKAFFADYYCSLLMFTKRNFATEELFSLEGGQSNSFKHYRLLKNLDIFLQERKPTSKFRQNFVLNDYHQVLFVLIYQQLYYVFFELVRNLPENIRGDSQIWSARLNDIESSLNNIMSIAIKYNSLEVVEFTDKVLKFNFKSFKLGLTVYHIIKELNSTINDDLLKYLLEHDANILTLKQDETEGLIIKCLETEINKTALFTLKTYGCPDQKTKINKCCESLLNSKDHVVMHQDLRDVVLLP